MSEVVKSRVYEEGNFGLTAFDKTETSTNAQYSTGASIEGLMAVDITFSATRKKDAADDRVDYLNRTAPLKGNGTIKLMGFTKAMYSKFYNNIVDNKGVVVLGKKNQTKAIGLVFYNTENYEGGSSENMFVLPNVTMELPNLSTQTIAEDDTTTRDYTITIEANAQNYQYADGETTKRDRYTCAILNSVDNADIYNANKGKVYIPDGAQAGTIL